MSISAAEKITFVRLPLVRNRDEQLQKILEEGKKYRPSSEQEFLAGLERSRKQYKNNKCGDAWALAEEARALIRNR